MVKWIFIGVGILFILGIIKVLMSVKVQEVDRPEDYLYDKKNNTEIK